MVNMQDFIGNNPLFNKFEVDELLFAEFKCPMDEGDTSLWWHNNFFAYVLTGETIIKTPRGTYTLTPDTCVFAKKGSVISRTKLDDDFCEILVFVPDDFIKSVVQKHQVSLAISKSNTQSDTIIRLSTDDVLSTYFYSLLTYFHQKEPPSKTLLKLKFEELLVNILSNKNHLPLKCYFGEVCASVKPSIQDMMEANFSQNLSQEEFARLCARSLSAFKVEFKYIFNTSPGKWLLEKRLEYSRYLLETTDDTVDKISYTSGFKNRSHFIRVFKERYGKTPGKHRLTTSDPRNKTAPTS